MFPVLSGIYKLGSVQTEVTPTVQRLVCVTERVDYNWTVASQSFPLGEGKDTIPGC